MKKMKGRREKINREWKREREERERERLKEMWLSRRTG